MEFYLMELYLMELYLMELLDGATCRSYLMELLDGGMELLELTKPKSPQSRDFRVQLLRKTPCSKMSYLMELLAGAT